MSKNNELDSNLVRVCAELVLDPHDYADLDPEYIVPTLAAYAYAELHGIRYANDLTARFHFDQLPTWEQEGWGA
jgi:hypothetical protein